MTDSVVFIKEPLLILIALVEPKTLRYSRYGKTFSNFVIITEGGTVPMKKRVFVLIMCIIFLLGGCSSQNHSMNPSNEAGSYPSEAIAGDEEKGYGSADYSEDYSDTQEESQAASSTEGDKREPEIGDTDNQKLVYTCDMTIETLEYQETMKSIKDSISKYNGITEKETQTDDDTYWYDEGRKRTGTMRSYLVIRIPAASYNAFLEELEGSGKIVSKDLSVDNITKHYTEVKTTIKSLQIQEKRLLDMMINSIYTHKEIFLRELISNASDAIDKLYFKSLTDDKVGLNKDDFAIWISADKDSRTLKITDNGIGMTEEELENNLGTIANSGSFKFKNENKLEEDNQIIGQFGVGFYSAFMVAKKVTVISKAYGSDKAYQWESEGVDGYTITEADKKNTGTEIILEMLPFPLGREGPLVQEGLDDHPVHAAAPHPAPAEPVLQHAGVHPFALAQAAGLEDIAVLVRPGVREDLRRGGVRAVVGRDGMGAQESRVVRIQEAAGEGVVEP